MTYYKPGSDPKIVEADKVIKIRATKDEKRRVARNHKPPQDIYVTCSDGVWVKRLTKVADDRFWWERWVKQ